MALNLSSIGTRTCSEANLARNARPMNRMPTPTLTMVLPPNNQPQKADTGFTSPGLVAPVERSARIPAATAGAGATGRAPADPPLAGTAGRATSGGGEG